MNREKVTSVRFNDMEHAAATELAAEQGFSLSSWIRSLTLRELKKKRKATAAEEAATKEGT